MHPRPRGRGDQCVKATSVRCSRVSGLRTLTFRPVSHFDAQLVRRHEPSHDDSRQAVKCRAKHAGEQDASVEPLAWQIGKGFGRAERE